MFSGKRLNIAQARRALRRNNYLEVWFEGRVSTSGADMLIQPTDIVEQPPFGVPLPSWALRDAVNEHKVTLGGRSISND